MAQSRERSASLDSDLAEIKFWTFSIGCKNLRQCVRDAPSSIKSFDVPQSDWWKEPGLSQRRDALRELTTCEATHVVDTRCLRDTEGSASRHLGTNLVNMRGMCHNANMKGLIKDIWTCIEDLLREACKLAKPGARVDVALGFVCNSGRRRSVCISEMTTRVLSRLGFFVDLEHMCSADWGHLCKGNCPCPTCKFVAADLPWAPWFDWYYVEMMKCAQRRGCHIPRELKNTMAAPRNATSHHALNSPGLMSTRLPLISFSFSLNLCFRIPRGKRKRETGYRGFRNASNEHPRESGNI